MNNKKTKRVTIADLAKMIKEDVVDRMATKEDLKIQQDVSQIILKEVKTIHEDNKYFRQSISSLNMNDFTYDRKLENLTVRVEKLEKAK
jgi:hypothetical protein